MFLPIRTPRFVQGVPYWFQVLPTFQNPTYLWRDFVQIWYMSSLKHPQKHIRRVSWYFQSCPLFDPLTWMKVHFMAVSKKVFFSETKRPMLLKLCMNVLNYKDSQVCFRCSDLILNMTTVTYFSKILQISIWQLFVKGFCLNWIYAQFKAFPKTY